MEAAANKEIRHGIKRSHSGFPKKTAPRQEVVRNAYTSMFEGFRNEIDEHHDRRERIIKASKDITAASKKMIFTLLRTRQLGAPLPQHLEQEFLSRLKEISRHLGTILPEIRGINRHRYRVQGMEEYVEAVSLCHYLRYQTLITPEQAVGLFDNAQREEADEEDGKEKEKGTKLELELKEEEYLGGIFDLFGEMMRFATNMAGLCGTLTPSPASTNTLGAAALEDDEEKGEKMDVDMEVGERGGRSILSDMHELASCMEILPFARTGKNTRDKIEAMRASVQKVEKLGYGLVVRGSERPAGWMPDLSDEQAPTAEA